MLSLSRLSRAQRYRDQPKGTCMRNVTQAQCNHIADDLNHRPRKRFGYDTPAKLYHRN
jgi:IS30 family transposase